MNGRPHATHPPYKPADQYNPTTLANFFRAALKNPAWTSAQQRCVALNTARWIVNESATRTDAGVVSRWYPYKFRYSANPKTPTLEPGWYSGLAQERFSAC